jgi:hypothetical protein
MLYKIDPIVSLSNTIIPTLKIGDIVKFGGFNFPTDSLNNSACPIVGIANCYQLIQQPDTAKYSLSGRAMAGNEIIKSGMVYLFSKENPKPIAVTTITDSIYQFNNVLVGYYTVYVIPNIAEYPTSLPTFYKDKFRYTEANYINVNENKKNIVVMLNSYEMPKGKGIVRGIIFFENSKLKDSVMNALIQYRGVSVANDRSASAVPVALYNGYGNAVAWSVSDELGNYSIENIANGSYKVVSETGSAKAETMVNVTDANSIVNVDLILKTSADVTGVENKNIITNFYPNPVHNTLNINANDTSEAYLYNTMGKVILQTQLYQGLNSIDFSNYQQGIYLLKTNNNTVKIRKE